MMLYSSQSTTYSKKLMSILIVVSIIVVLSALACYAFIRQSIEKKQIQKQRILMALKTKHRNHVHLINGFPPNFLPSDLQALVLRAIIEICEQLSEIEPKEPRHRDEITLLTNQLAALPKNSPAQRARLDNPQQMKDIHQHLIELKNFITQQETQKNINKVQAEAYSDQIQRLTLQMSVDAYIYQAKQAQQAGKARLAIHFFTLAKKQLVGENATHIYDKQISQIDIVVSKLEEAASSHNQTSPKAEDPATSAPANKEWEKFAKPEETWKKKNIYD